MYEENMEQKLNCIQQKSFWEYYNILNRKWRTILLPVLVIVLDLIMTLFGSPFPKSSLLLVQVLVVIVAETFVIYMEYRFYKDVFITKVKKYNGTLFFIIAVGLTTMLWLSMIVPIMSKGELLSWAIGGVIFSLIMVGIVLPSMNEFARKYAVQA